MHAETAVQHGKWIRQRGSVRRPRIGADSASAGGVVAPGLSLDPFTKLWGAIGNRWAGLQFDFKLSWVATVDGPNGFHGVNQSIKIPAAMLVRLPISLLAFQQFQWDGLAGSLQSGAFRLDLF